MKKFIYILLRILIGSCITIPFGFIVSKNITIIIIWGLVFAYPFSMVLIPYIKGEK